MLEAYPGLTPALSSTHTAIKSRKQNTLVVAEEEEHSMATIKASGSFVVK